MAKRSFSQRSRVAGFTLVELMVTLVVATVLFTIALPSYQTQIRKSRRVEAKTAVLDLAGREETLYSTTNAYSVASASVGYGAGGFPASVGSNYYTVTVVIPNPASPAGQPSFLVTARPVAGTNQAKDTACASFSVDQLGNQSALNSAGADNSKTCWGN
jgi:type IV pilus assembly protein PilE